MTGGLETWPLFAVSPCWALAPYSGTASFAPSIGRSVAHICPITADRKMAIIQSKARRVEGIVG